MIYTATVMGWQFTVDAPNARSALTQAKQVASSASLLPSDVTAAHIHRATAEEIDWYREMGGEL